MFAGKNLRMTQKKASLPDLIKRGPVTVCEKEMCARPRDTKSFYVSWPNK